MYLLIKVVNEDSPSPGIVCPVERGILGSSCKRHCGVQGEISLVSYQSTSLEHVMRDFLIFNSTRACDARLVDLLTPPNCKAEMPASVMLTIIRLKEVQDFGNRHWQVKLILGAYSETRDSEF